MGKRSEERKNAQLEYIDVMKEIAADIASPKNPYEHWIKKFECSSFQEFYSKLEEIGKEKLGLEEIPCTLSDLEHCSPEGQTLGDINDFIIKCAKKFTGNESEAQVKKLLENLAEPENKPEVSYENPKVAEGELTKDEKHLVAFIFYNGIDLPGSKLNLYGKPGYFSDFFMDMYLGNLTEAMEYFNSLSKKEQKTALTVREGFCQFSPIFAPIIGQKMAYLENDITFTTEEKKKVKLLFNLNNENKQFDILKKLLRNGADANAHDKFGFTALHHAVRYRDYRMVTELIKHRANPNAESRDGTRPLSLFACPAMDGQQRMISELLQHNGNLTNKEHADNLRAKVEKYSSLELAVRVREAMPRDKNECEKCLKPASKKCAACNLVVYCSSECQKADWKFHKVTCKKNRDS